MIRSVLNENFVILLKRLKQLSADRLSSAPHLQLVWFRIMNQECCQNGLVLLEPNMLSVCEEFFLRCDCDPVGEGARAGTSTLCISDVRRHPAKQ
jgi:hypothetical protein